MEGRRVSEKRIDYNRLQAKTKAIERAVRLPQLSDEAIKELTIYCDSQGALKTLASKNNEI